MAMHFHLACCISKTQMLRFLARMRYCTIRI